MSNKDREIITLSTAIIKFLGDVKTYQKFLLNQQEQVKKLES